MHQACCCLIFLSVAIVAVAAVIALPIGAGSLAGTSAAYIVVYTYH